jgi:glycosyltransferase involved in cell wall biosynthesis
VCDLDNLSVVIPCYEEDHGILASLSMALEDLGIEVIIVDDGSKNPYIRSIWHNENLGYGQAIMTGIGKASRPIILIMDGDGQHRVKDVINLYNVWEMLNVDMVIGSRRLNYENPVRMWGRKCLNFIASIFTGIYMQDLNSGMRIFKRDIAVGYFPILCKKFSFTTSITMSYMCDGYRVEWFPINVEERLYGKSHVNIIKDGLVTLYYILRIGLALRTRRIRSWIRKICGVRFLR